MSGQQQSSKKGKPNRAGSRSAKIAWYWSTRHPENMARRAFKAFKRYYRLGMRLEHARGIGRGIAHTHAVEARYEKLVDVYLLRRDALWRALEELARKNPLPDPTTLGDDSLRPIQ